MVAAGDGDESGRGLDVAGDLVPGEGEALLGLLLFGQRHAIGLLCQRDRQRHLLADLSQADLLPLQFQTDAGLQIKLKLFTVPGQVIHNATRKIVLQGADGVAFVADSRVTQTRENNQSFANLKQNLRDNGIGWDDVAIVIQFNKRDLEGIRTDAEVDRIASKGREPVFKAVALTGEGVAETFVGLCSSAWQKLERKYELENRFQVTHSQFINEVRRMLGPAGEAVAVPSVDDTEAK